jgi:hypothetical protein
MPLALAAWHVLARRRRWWHTPALVLMTVVAVGFKEQGLVMVAIILAAWVTGTPGSTRAQPIIAVVLAVAYVAMRIVWHRGMPAFEQTIGLGFTEIGTEEATARFGGFPYGVYAYTSAATIANVLFSEPTNGVFRLVFAVTHHTAEPWQYVQLVSSLALTVLVIWWAAQALSHVRAEGWSGDSRVAVALLFAVAACGALSFNYSRDRLDGMAVPFYALAAFHALRAAASRAIELRPAAYRAVAAGLVLLVGLWHVRAVGTVEGVRVTSARNQMEWLATLPQRTREFADRPVYLSILGALHDQGTAESAPLPTIYPRPLVGVFTPSETLAR